MKKNVRSLTDIVLSARTWAIVPPPIKTNEHFKTAFTDATIRFPVTPDSDCKVLISGGPSPCAFKGMISSSEPITNF